MSESLQIDLESYMFCQCKADTWLNNVATKIASNVTPEYDGISDAHKGYASCPLCGATSASPYQFGFTLPEGLRRHLTGIGHSNGCKGVEAAKGLADEYFENKFKT